MAMTRRDLLSASAASRWRRPWRPRMGRAVAAEADIVVIGAGAAGIAAARRIQAANRKVDRGRGGGQHRRALPDRYRDVRRAVRSRRALAAQSRHQPDDQARAQCRARYLPRRRSARRSASASATRAPAKPRNSWQRWCAPTAPSTTPRAARPTSPAPRCCRRISATGRARREFVLGANRHRQGSRGCVGHGQGPCAGSQCARSVCRQGCGALIARLGEQVAGGAVDAGEPDRLERPRCRGGNSGRAGSPRAPPSSRCRATCSRRAISSSRPRSAEAPARRRGKIRARQLRPHRPANAGQPAGAAARRGGHRAEQLHPHGAAVGQYRRIIAVPDRCRRLVRPRSFRPGREGDGRVRGGMAEQAVRQRHRGRGQEIERDALECVAVHARRDVGGCARRASQSRKILAEPIGSMFLAGEAPTRPCGARSMAPGKAASVPPKRRCERSARSASRASRAGRAARSASAAVRSGRGE